jgi:hypothetical protein
MLEILAALYFAAFLLNRLFGLGFGICSPSPHLPFQSAIPLAVRHRPLGQHLLHCCITPRVYVLSSRDSSSAGGRADDRKENINV